MIKIINHIKLHTLNSCLFAQLSEEMDTVHTFSVRCDIQRSEMTLKGQSFGVTRAAPEISFRKKVTTGSILQ